MNRQSELTRKPAFVRFFRSDQAKYTGPTLNVHMFTEDIVDLMPYGFHKGSKNRTVKFEGSEAERARAIHILQGMSEHTYGLDADTVCRAINDLAKRIAWEGRALFEILPCEDGSVFLHSVTSRRMVRIFGLAVQFVPRKDRALWGGPRFRRAVGSSLWNVDIPRCLGGRRSYLRTLKRLERFDGFGPAFFQKDMQSGLIEARFDHRKYNRMISIFKSIVTYQWGWNYRDWSMDNSTEFFDVYRRLREERAKVMFRDHIIGEINKLFSRLSIHCVLSVDGLLTLSEVDALEKNLISGELSFSDLLDRVSKT
ncbi:hypothetical protein [Dyella mobilis]|uniref:Replication initiator protein A n=1 Tax=Dyella mobilis TaxID=1849582 RepID=A0ABS2KJB3_9GAMM|nr:hypothetical protein [Dyella mobilis]MBM7131267.1 hypothetical protein [Dyella mobilis]